MTDLEICRSRKLENVIDVGKKIGLDREDLICYGDFKAKIVNSGGTKSGKLILVTAINPTPFGEGKTTVSIGLGDALSKMDKNPVIVLRQPSMGPVFGMKGGATGGGYSQVVPMEDINLHFTGDFHAITSANNLLAAAIDNHIFQGNELKIEKVLFNRCLDVNDRALRKIELDNRKEKFNITAASEIMALFCLATSINDLKLRLGNIIIGLNSDGNYVYAKDLKIEDSLSVLLKDAFYPNLVQTLENTPTIIHGGPFANIAHGCNSVVATKLGLSLGDYVITEAGFGADLGAEKFLDIVCQSNDLKLDCVVLVATIKALKYNGGVSKDDIEKENMEALKNGICNLEAHISNLNKFGINIVVALNKYESDSLEEIRYIEDFCCKLGVDFSVSTAYSDGSDGALKLANKVVELCSRDNCFNPIYKNSQSIKDKINIICKEIYHAKDVEYSDEILGKIDILDKNGKSYLPICVAKTQYSLSDDKSKLGSPNDYIIHISDIVLYNGAGFITVILGDTMLMPGLPKKPNYINIKLDDGKIEGLF